MEIAQLSDPQLDGQEMANGARLLHPLTEWVLARRSRRHLRFVAGLGREQRQAVTRPDGVPFTRLSLEQQQFVALALGTEAERLPSLEALSGAALRVDYYLPGRFEWKAPRAPDGPYWSTLLPAPVRETTQQAALAAARRIDPGAQAAQINLTELSLTFLYTLGPPEFASPAILQVDSSSNSSVPARIPPRS
jgi:hypothetical protein